MSITHSNIIQNKKSLEIFSSYKKWLMNPQKPFNECCQTVATLEYIISISPKLKKLEIDPNCTDCISMNHYINLIMQFYIDKDNDRQREIMQTLYLNVNNNSINKIYLFNERIYTDEELGIKSDKIVQIDIKNRLKFSNVFDLIEEHNINGYVAIANSDIFFDKSIENVTRYDLINKNVLTLCRYEFDGINRLRDCSIFAEGRPDSQDAWIFHSGNNIPKQYRNVFDFEMGKPGCDNKLIYLFQILGYQCYNEPSVVKIYHNHNTPSRNYSIKDIIPSPWCVIYPTIENDTRTDKDITYNLVIENDRLNKYLENKIQNNKHFIIPRIAGIENKLAYFGVTMMQNKDNYQPQLLEKFLSVMKKNAGIKITNSHSIMKYATTYLQAFHECDLYFDWEPWGNVAQSIFDSLLFIHLNFNKTRVSALTLDIFHNIHLNPWTRTLRGKRLLIISPFVDSMREKLNHREKIYGIELFPECEFVFLKPPQTQANCPSEEFDIELEHFVYKIKEIKDDFDIALVSCGGYGNIVCSKIYQMNRSAIYIGGVLQMYFGIYGTRWERERGDIMKLYKNEYWTRPKETERPDGFQNVENSCYW
jgi:hypothetical protein